MNIQEHSSPFYNVTLYKIFFDQKYHNCINSFSTIEKAGLEPIKFINKWINNAVNKNLFIINEIMKKYFKYKAYEEDKEEDRKENKEENEKEDEERDEEEDGKEVEKENKENDRKDNREEDGGKNREKNKKKNKKKDGEKDRKKD